ncbi:MULTISPECIES: histidine phosphatase family protein [Spirulina sp. CCY15215]|uniref:histidine phosphatase family protein n=1 Tax=Spirulina sp. CCY15215 TaxID=2767591 RepID=UPI00194EB1A1|nr:histidine phosphatase family protein [Spirulina major]
MTQTIWIARHANRFDFVNPEWFETAEHRYDPPLSEDGFIQAKELGKRLQLEKIVHIFASPFLRTVQTANEIAYFLDLPIKLEAGLGEWLNPDWMSKMPEILSREELAQQYPRIDLRYQSRVIPEFPENEAEVMDRTARTVQQLVSEFSEDILLVGHGSSVLGTIRGLVPECPDFRVPLCCLFKVVKDSEKWIVELEGDTSHLSQSESKIRFN